MCVGRRASIAFIDLAMTSLLQSDHGATDAQPHMGDDGMDFVMDDGMDFAVDDDFGGDLMSLVGFDLMDPSGALVTSAILLLLHFFHFFSKNSFLAM